MATKEEIAAMTNQQNHARAPKYLLDEVHFMGKSSDSKKYPIEAGHFKLKVVTGERDEKDGYLQKDMGAEPMEVVFLKIRRVLSEYRKAGSLRTNEHNSKHDVVTLFGTDGGPQIGTSDELRERNQKLRTHQIVYVYVVKLKRVCRLIVKGLSLGSQEKMEGITNFYEYISAFNAEKLHMHHFITKLVPTQVEDFYCMNFVRGEKLDDLKLKKIEDLIVEASGECSKLDAYYAEQQAKKLGKQSNDGKDAPAKNEGVQDAALELDTVEYPEEEIDVEDIPF